MDAEGSLDCFSLGSALPGVSPTEDVVLVCRDGSALRAGVLSSCFAKKKVAKEEGDPRLRGRLRRLPCATRCWRGHPKSTSSRCCASFRALRNSALRASDSPRPLSAISSVARRSTWGPGKASRNDGSAQEEKRKSLAFNGRPLERSKKHLHRFGGDAFRVPLRGAEQRRFERKEGEDCLRAKPEFRSPRSNRVAQGTRAAGADPGVAFSLATFFWRSKRKYARPQGGTQRKTSTTPTVAEAKCVIHAHPTPGKQHLSWRPPSC